MHCECEEFCEKRLILNSINNSNSIISRSNVENNENHNCNISKICNIFNIWVAVQTCIALKLLTGD